MSNCEKSPPLGLPSSPGGEDPVQFTVGSESKMKIDAFGPMVVNSDGTLSRIANWPSMTELERERTMRVLIARNKIRLANQEAKLNEEAAVNPI